MTESSDDTQRPASSPALQRAERAIQAARAAAEESPAQQAPLLAEAQARLAELLAEGQGTGPTASDQH